jgi:hypothetical protein
MRVACACVWSSDRLTCACVCDSHRSTDNLCVLCAWCGVWLCAWCVVYMTFIFFCDHWRCSLPLDRLCWLVNPRSSFFLPMFEMNVSQWRIWIDSRASIRHAHTYLLQSSKHTHSDNKTITHFIAQRKRKPLPRRFQRRTTSLRKQFIFVRKTGMHSAAKALQLYTRMLRYSGNPILTHFICKCITLYHVRRPQAI